MLLYDDMKNRGRFGDTELAHVNPQEMALLQALGGSGTINPFTGRPEFFNPNYWVPPEDPVENAASNDSGDSGGQYQTEDPDQPNYIDPSWIEDWQSSGFTSGGGATSPQMYMNMKRLSDPNWQIPDEWKVPWQTDRTGKDKNLGINLGDQLGLDASLGDKLTGTGDTKKPTFREYLQGLGPNIGEQSGLDAGLGEHLGLTGDTADKWAGELGMTADAGERAGLDASTFHKWSDELGLTADPLDYGKQWLGWEPQVEYSDNGDNSSSVEGGMKEDQFKEYLFGKMRGEIDTPYESYDEERFADFDPMQDTAFDKVATFGASTPQEMIDAASVAKSETGYTSGFDSGTSTSGYAPTDYTSGYTTAGVDPAAFQKEIDARMSPFTGSVINQLQEDITEQQQLALGQTAEQARASGAFGGSREGIERAKTSGRYADAFTRGAGQLRADQFNKAVAGADVDRQMKERFGQGAYGLTQQARQAKEGFRQGAFGQTEQARQAEETANRLAASTRLAAGSELRTTGQALGDADARRINALAAAGAQKQDLDQALKDFQYNQFVEGRDWDKSNILTGGGLIGAVPPDDPPVYGREGGALSSIWDIIFGKNRQIA